MNLYRNNLTIGDIPQLDVVVPSFDFGIEITITGQTGAGTNYQVPLLIGESAGSGANDFDLGGLADLFPTGKNVSGSLRFKGNGSNLSFWVESVTGTTPNRVAKIWVKVAESLDTNKTIFCAYEGDTTNVSSGDNTFVLFDDFDGSGSVDSLKWDTEYAVSLQGDSTVKIGGSNSKYSGLYSLDTFGDGYSVVARTYITSTIYGTHNSGSFGRTDGPGSTIGYTTQWNSPYQKFDYEGGVFNLGTSYNYTYHVFESKRKGNGAAQLLINGASIASVASGSGNTAYPITSWAYHYDYNYIDYVFVRKIIATEPSFLSAS